MVVLTITGAINGVNAAFSLNAVPLTLELYRNGLLQAPGVDYTISGNDITFLAGCEPQVGDVLAALTDAATTIPIAPPSVTVQSIYDQVCYVCLEDGGFVLGLFTEAQFLEALSTVLLDFSQRCALDKTIFTEQINAGVAEYTVPEDMMVPELCFIGGRLIEKATEESLLNGHFEWRREWGVPRQWHEDNLDVKTVEVYPKPDYNGTNIAGGLAIIGKYGDFYPTERNLTMVGPSSASKTTWTLADTLDGIPGCFTPYLVYGILAEIFSGESEERDASRANYCRTRFEEAERLAEAIAREELLEEESDQL